MVITVCDKHHPQMSYMKFKMTTTHNMNFGLEKKNYIEL